jgi:hypothetical protein
VEGGITLTDATSRTFEVISNVEITQDSELLLRLESGGKPSYQYIYRAARGIYWDEERHGFKFKGPVDWPHAKWFSHVVEIIHSEFRLKLVLGESVAWENVPEDVRKSIQGVTT